jgi:hypothetical protein
MTITLKPEQERVLIEAINSGLAQSTDEALDQALEALKHRLPQKVAPDESVAAAARRLAMRSGCSLATADDDLRGAAVAENVLLL